MRGRTPPSWMDKIIDLLSHSKDYMPARKVRDIGDSIGLY